MRLILIRHPKPDVGPGVCYGRTDVAVAPAQLERTMAALPDVLPADLPLHLPVYASPLQRCSLLARRMSPAPIFDARLVEMDFGDWEMQSWDDIARTDIDAWAADVTNHRPGGGESVLQMATRIAAFYADLQRQLGNAGQAIVVCHAGTMRLLAACHAGLLPADMAQLAAATPHQIPYGSVLVLPHADD